MKLRLSRQLHRDVLRLADVCGMSEAEVCRRAVRRSLRRVAAAATRETATRADSVVLDVAGLALPDGWAPWRVPAVIAQEVRAALEELRDRPPFVPAEGDREPYVVVENEQ